MADPRPGALQNRASCVIADRQGLDDQLDRACADGRIGVEDAAEVRLFADFLAAAGPAQTSPDFDPRRYDAAYRRYYPPNYAAAFADLLVETDRARG